MWRVDAQSNRGARSTRRRCVARRRIGHVGGVRAASRRRCGRRRSHRAPSHPGRDRLPGLRSVGARARRAAVREGAGCGRADRAGHRDRRRGSGTWRHAGRSARSAPRRRRGAPPPEVPAGLGRRHRQSLPDPSRQARPCVRGLPRRDAGDGGTAWRAGTRPCRRGGPLRAVAAAGRRRPGARHRGARYDRRRRRTSHRPRPAHRRPNGPRPPRSLMRLPAPRGPLSTAVISALGRGIGPATAAELREASTSSLPGDVLADDDVAITLWTIYEFSYGGFDDADERWEWNPDLLTVRLALEDAMETQLRAETASEVEHAVTQSGDVAERLFSLIEHHGGPPLAGFLQRHATRSQMLEFLIHRSVYHLKESDPHSFVLPRLTGSAKVALAELQYDEYGAGRPRRLHSTLFAQTLDAVGLSSRYGDYVDRVPAVTLSSNNAMSLFALNRRLHAADMGHLGAFEATSSLPCRRIAGGLRRLEFGDDAADYFDEHVEADAVHEQLAIRGICAPIADADPRMLEDIFFGAAVCLALDDRVGDHLLRHWERDTTSLFDLAERVEVGSA